MIDLTGVGRLLEYKVADLIDAVDGARIEDREDANDKAAQRTEKAELSRQLLELADVFALCESIVRNEYWVFKGRGVDVEIGVYVD